MNSIQSFGADVGASPGASTDAPKPMLAGTGGPQHVPHASFGQVFKGLGHAAADTGFPQDGHTHATAMGSREGSQANHAAQSVRHMASRHGKADDHAAVALEADQQHGDSATNGAASHPLATAIHFVMASLWQALPEAVREEGTREGGHGASGEMQGLRVLQQLMTMLSDHPHGDQRLMTMLSDHPHGDQRLMTMLSDHRHGDKLQQLMRNLAENMPQPRVARLTQDTSRATPMDGLQDEVMQARDRDASHGPSNLLSKGVRQAVAPQEGHAGPEQGLTASETEAQLADWPLAATSMMKEAKTLLSQPGSPQLGAAAMTAQPDAMQDLRDLGLRLLAPLPEMVAASWQNSPTIPLPWEGNVPAATLSMPIQNAAWLSGPQGGIQGLHLQTNIAQLGDVMIRIDMLDGLRRIQLVADNLASAHALSLSAPRLEQQLAQAGLQDVRVHVNLNSHSPFASLGQHDAAHQHQSFQGSHHAPETGGAVLPPEPALLPGDQTGWQSPLAGPHAVNYLA